MSALQWDQAIRFQLDQARQELAQTTDLPRIADIRFRTGTDSTGDPAVWIWVVLARGTPRELAAQEHLSRIAQKIRSCFQPSPVVVPMAPAPFFALNAIPYVYFEREEERT